jgi:hypothetical protein
MNALSLSKSTPRQPGEQTLGTLDRVHDEIAFARDQRQALGPAGGDIHHRQSLDERTRNRRAAVGHHIDLAVAGRGVLPVVKRSDWHFAADRRVKPSPPSTTACRRNLHVAEHSIDRRGAHCEQLRLLHFAELQPPVSRQCRHKGRDHHHQPLAAHSIRRLPQGGQCVLDHHAVAALAPTRRYRLN